MKRNWYDSKWKNKKAIENRARRTAKFARRGILNPARSSMDTPSEEVGRYMGIIAEVQKFHCLVMYGDEYLKCDVRDIPTLEDLGPLVIGDRVSFDIQKDGRVLVRSIMSRKTKLVRMRADRTRLSVYAQEEHVLAANVDSALIVVSAAQPPFHPRLVDRYLIMCQYGNVVPVICMNKIDLVEEPPDLSLYQGFNISVVYFSALTGKGLEHLSDVIKGKFIVLTGQSGVGKSTIINYLLGGDRLSVKEVGSKSGKGRHTTVVSTLHKLKSDTYLIDTPGIRSLGLWEIDKEALRLYFREFEDFAPNCKFRDCLHKNEPECMVKKALSEGKIPPERYASYIRMLS